MDFVEAILHVTMAGLGGILSHAVTDLVYIVNMEEFVVKKNCFYDMAWIQPVCISINAVPALKGLIQKVIYPYKNLSVSYL